MELMSRSVDTIWIVLTPLAGLGLCCVLFARKYTLKRNVVREGDKRPGSSEADSEQNEGKIAEVFGMESMENGDLKSPAGSQQSSGEAEEKE